VAVNPPPVAYQLTAIFAVREQEEQILAGRLRALAALDVSPFARLPATHYVRLAPFNRLGADRPGEVVEELGAPYLLAGVVFDGDPDRYLLSLARVCRQEVGAIFGCCQGWPGSQDLAAFAAWVRQHECASLHRFGASPAAAPQIQAALALRRRVVGFAAGSQDLSPEDLHDAYRKEFGAS
jgi:hypothetical protein